MPRVSNNAAKGNFTCEPLTALPSMSTRSTENRALINIASLLKQPKEYK